MFAGNQQNKENETELMSVASSSPLKSPLSVDTLYLQQLNQMLSQPLKELSKIKRDDSFIMTSTPMDDALAQEQPAAVSTTFRCFSLSATESQKETFDHFEVKIAESPRETILVTSDSSQGDQPLIAQSIPVPLSIPNHFVQHGDKAHHKGMDRLESGYSGGCVDAKGDSGENTSFDAGSMLNLRPLEHVVFSRPPETSPRHFEHDESNTSTEIECVESSREEINHQSSTTLIDDDTVLENEIDKDDQEKSHFRSAMPPSVAHEMITSSDMDLTEVHETYKSKSDAIGGVHSSSLRSPRMSFSLNRASSTDDSGATIQQTPVLSHLRVFERTKHAQTPKTPFAKAVTETPVTEKMPTIHRRPNPHFMKPPTPLSKLVLANDSPSSELQTDRLDTKPSISVFTNFGFGSTLPGDSQASFVQDSQMTVDEHDPNNSHEDDNPDGERTKPDITLDYVPSQIIEFGEVPDPHHSASTCSPPDTANNQVPTENVEQTTVDHIEMDKAEIMPSNGCIPAPGTSTLRATVGETVPEKTMELSEKPTFISPSKPKSCDSQETQPCEDVADHDISNSDTQMTVVMDSPLNEEEKRQELLKSFIETMDPVADSPLNDNHLIINDPVEENGGPLTGDAEDDEIQIIQSSRKRERFDVIPESQETNHGKSSPVCISAPRSPELHSPEKILPTDSFVSRMIPAARPTTLAPEKLVQPNSHLAPLARFSSTQKTVKSSQDSISFGDDTTASTIDPGDISFDVPKKKRRWISAFFRNQRYMVPVGETAQAAYRPLADSIAISSRSDAYPWHLNPGDICHYCVDSQTDPIPCVIVHQDQKSTFWIILLHSLGENPSSAIPIKAAWSQLVLNEQEHRFWSWKYQAGPFPFPLTAVGTPLTRPPSRSLTVSPVIEIKQMKRASPAPLSIEKPISSSASRPKRRPVAHESPLPSNQKRLRSGGRQLDLDMAGFPPGMFRGYSFWVTSTEKDSEDDRKELQQWKDRLLKAGADLLDFPLPTHSTSTRRTAEKKKQLLIAHRACRSTKYLLALADGIPRVNVTWLRECNRLRRLVDVQDYLLPNGVVAGGEGRSVETIPPTVLAKSKGILDGLYIYLLSSFLRENERETWNTIIRTAGGQVPTRRTSPLLTYFLLLDDHQPVDRKLIQQAQQQKKPILSKEWLCLSLIHQRRLDPALFRVDLVSSSSVVAVSGAASSSTASRSRAGVASSSSSRGRGKVGRTGPIVDDTDDEEQEEALEEEEEDIDTLFNKRRPASRASRPKTSTGTGSRRKATRR